MLLISINIVVLLEFSNSTDGLGREEVEGGGGEGLKYRDRRAEMSTVFD